MPGIRLLCLVLALLGAALATSAHGDAPSEEPVPPPDRLAWWREARFGLFVHWGLYAVPAGQWGEATNHAEWIRTTAKIPLDTYDELSGRFDPKAYDPATWARLAKAAGMGYVVITSKHHDGFCLWDSKETDFDVGGTPHGKDLLTPLADACREEGLRFCVYHSIMDWHHADYLPRRDWELPNRPVGDADFDRYVGYLHRQVGELLTLFPDLGILWFDGQWESTWDHARGQALYDLCLARAPRIIVNDRVDVGRMGHSARIVEGCAGDYGTPEQAVPDEGLLDHDWETCLTMNDHWGWNEADRKWKSSKTLIRTLVDIVSKNGNLLLNVGPKPDGTFPQEAVDRLQAIGAWMDVYGEAIHGTTGSPFDPMPWGRCTVKARGADTTIYCAVFDWPEDRRLVVPGVGNEIRRAAIPGHGEVEVVRDGLDLVVSVPVAMPTPACTVVSLEAKGAPLAFRIPAIEAPADGFVHQVEVRLTAPSALEVRYTLDGSDPTEASPRYERPFLLEATTTVRARSYHEGRPVSGASERRLEKVAPWAPTEVEGAKPGLVRRIYAGDWDLLPDFDTLTPESTAIATTIGLEPDPRREHVGRRFTGFLRVNRADLYEFVLNSDDGSRLVIDGRVVIDNDGLHSWRERMGTAPLARGLHVLEVEAFNKGGPAELRLLWGPPGSVRKPPSPDVLFHR